MPTTFWTPLQCFVMCAVLKRPTWECCQQFAVTEAIWWEGTTRWSCLKLQQESASRCGKMSYSKGPELLKIYKDKKRHEIRGVLSCLLCNVLSECSHSTLIITYSWVLCWKTLKRDKSEITTKLAVKTTGKYSFWGYKCSSRKKANTV